MQINHSCLLFLSNEFLLFFEKCQNCLFQVPISIEFNGFTQQKIEPNEIQNWSSLEINFYVFFNWKIISIIYIFAVLSVAHSLLLLLREILHVVSSLQTHKVQELSKLHHGNQHEFFTMFSVFFHSRFSHQPNQRNKMDQKSLILSILAISLTILIFSSETQACSCYPSHPQTSYCNSEYGNKTQTPPQ